MSFEVPAGFLLTVAAPHRYSTNFADLETQRQISVVLRDVGQAWFQAAATADAQRLQREKGDAGFEELFATLLGGHTFDKHAESLDRLCHWRDGQYRLRMIVRTSRPDAEFTGDWAFELTEADANTLHMERWGAIRQTCGRPSFYPAVSVQYTAT